MSHAITELFEQQVEKSKRDIAVIDGLETFTYEDLNKRANQLARHLVQQGVEPQNNIAVYMDRSIDLVVTILALWKINAVYVPLDTSYPIARLEYILNDTKSKLLVFSDIANKNLFLHFNNALLYYKHTTLLEFPTKNLQNAIDPKNIAYIMYTSGSTGNPKGVQIPHRGIANRLSWTIREHNVGECGALLSIISIGFSVSLCEIFSPLLSRQKLVIGDNQAAKDPNYLREKIEKFNITFMHFVPSLLNVFLDAIPNKSCLSLQQVSCGGEGMPLDLCRKFFAKFPTSRLYNEYGATELSVAVTNFQCDPHTVEKYQQIPIGKPIDNTKIYLLDDNNRVVNHGSIGELCVSGDNLASGYLNLPHITEQSFFIYNDNEVKVRLYKTGDLAKQLTDGNYVVCGRKDSQIKLRGFRIELAEIEKVLSNYQKITQAIADVRTIDNDKHLVAYYCSDKDISNNELRKFLLDLLPSYMVPAIYIRIEKLPLNLNGKINRQLLPNPVITRNNVGHMQNGLQRKIIHIWQKALGIKNIDTNISIFDMGAHSLSVLKSIEEIYRDTKVRFSYQDILNNASINEMIAYINKALHNDKTPKKRKLNNKHHEAEQTPSLAEKDEIAVVGMSCSFPGAKNIHEYWTSLLAGNCSLQSYSIADLKKLGVDSQTIQDPNFVNVAGYMEWFDEFDAGFFKFLPGEARITDPHHRLFIQAAWDALEDAGLTSNQIRMKMGVFASMGDSQFLQSYLYGNDLVKRMTFWEKMMLSSPQYLANKVSYKLNLSGPSINVNTACSSSLVSICTACDAILAGNCDSAIAGGVSLLLPKEVGYIYKPYNIFSKQGKHIPFSNLADGIVISSGVGAVVLKSLSKAIKNRDHIYAVIKGYALNNDGDNDKASFIAPGLKGQTTCLLDAQKRANIKPESITYVEAHGASTPMGDKIELQSLNAVFPRAKSHRYCALGSVKANIGHCISAAGVAGFIKAVLCVKHRKLVPQIFHGKPLDELISDSSPFYLNKKTIEWNAIGNEPLRAAVSSLGMGGTNAHVIIEEPPKNITQKNSLSCNLKNFNILLSAKSEEGLYNKILTLRKYTTLSMTRNDLQNLAYTLQERIAHYFYREAFSCTNVKNFRQKLDRLLNNRFNNTQQYIDVKNKPYKTVFLFPGQGNQYIFMAHKLYQTNERFRYFMDKCCTLTFDILQENILDILFNKNISNHKLENEFNDTSHAKIALFSVEYALANIMLELGVYPDVILGHSLGEYVAACIAGIFTLEDAIHKLKNISSNIDTNYPKYKIISSLTGKYLEQTNSKYWQEQMLNPGKFHVGLDCVLHNYDNPIFIEIGPGHTLTTVVSQIAKQKNKYIQLLPNKKEFQNNYDDNVMIISALLSLWKSGIEIKWDTLYKYDNASVFSGYFSRLAPKSYWPTTLHAKASQVTIKNNLQLRSRNKHGLLQI